MGTSEQRSLHRLRPARYVRVNSAPKSGGMRIEKDRRGRTQGMYSVNAHKISNSSNNENL